MAKGKSGLPGNMKFRTESSKDLDALEKKFKSNTGGPVMMLGKNEDVAVAIMTTPDTWDTVYEHSIQGGGKNNSWVYIPCTDNCPACKRLPENQPRLYAYIPLYVYNLKRVQYFRAPNTVWNKMKKKFETNEARFLRNQYILSRIDGDGPTQYEFDRQDEKVKTSINKTEIPDFGKAIYERWKRALDQLDWKVSGEKFDDDSDEADSAFNHSGDDDIDIDEVKTMKKKELKRVIRNYNLDIEDPDDFNKTSDLRKVVIKALESLDEED